MTYLRVFFSKSLKFFLITFLFLFISLDLSVNLYSPAQIDHHESPTSCPPTQSHVSRKKKKEIPSDVVMIPVKEYDKTNTVLVQAGLAKNQETDELELYCHSIDKEKKEESIKTKFQERFEAELLKVRNALHLRNGTKRYDKVLERIGRLKERFKLVSHRYNVSVEKVTETDKDNFISWSGKNI